MSLPLGREREEPLPCAMTDTAITTLEPREAPEVGTILDEMEAATCAATHMDVWTRLEGCANALLCKWDGKQDDGRQPDPKSWKSENKNLFRWKGAPDAAVPLVDILVRWLTRIRKSVWNRGDARIGPQQLPNERGAEASGMSAVWQLVMDFFLYLSAFDYAYQFGLAARTTGAFGYSVLLADWQKKRRMEKKSMELQDIVDALVRRDVATQSAAMQQDEGLTEEQVAQLVEDAQMQVEMILMAENADLEQYVSLVIEVEPGIAEREAKEVLKALREDPAQPASYHMPRDDGGVPTLRAFVPWVQCIHSADMTGTGDCELFGYPEYLTESAMTEMAAAEGWDEAAVKQVLSDHKNQLYYSQFSALGFDVPSWAFNGVGVGLTPSEDVMRRIPHWMVWRVWRRVSNKAGLPSVYRGVIHHAMKDKPLLWEPTDLERIPIIVDTSEEVSYAIQARGVGDIVTGAQNAVKDTLDSEGARGRLGSNPPFLRGSGAYVGMKPGLEINGGLGRSGDGDKFNRFVPVPGVDSGALKVSAEHERWAREYYCYAPTTNPNDQRLFIEDLTFQSLRVMSRTLLTMWELIQENVKELHASSIAGRPVELDVNSRDQLAGKADIHVGFYSDGLNEDKADKFFDLLIKLGQSDKAARIDWEEAIEMAVQMRIPAYARRILRTKEGAQTNVKMDQELRLVKIAAGVPLDYPEEPTNPEARMQILEQWLSIPDNAPKTQVAATLMEKEQQYLSFGIQQQSTNPTIGRTGVKPNDDLAQETAA